MRFTVLALVLLLVSLAFCGCATQEKPVSNNLKPSGIKGPVVLDFYSDA